MTWQLTVAKTAAKKLKRIDAKDRNRIVRALDELRENPFTRGVVHLAHQHTGFRYRVGAYRILFDVRPKEWLVQVQDIVRRTTTTYTKR
jgi:mRNA interferase RelE/StbE